LEFFRLIANLGCTGLLLFDIASAGSGETVVCLFLTDGSILLAASSSSNIIRFNTDQFLRENNQFAIAGNAAPGED
jgi:hypothetical protein